MDRHAQLGSLIVTLRGELNRIKQAIHTLEQMERDDGGGAEAAQRRPMGHSARSGNHRERTVDRGLKTN